MIELLVEVWLIGGECYGRQGFDKNLTPQSVYVFRAFGNSFMSYMVF